MIERNVAMSVSFSRSNFNIIDGENIGSIKAHEKLGFEYAGTIKNAGYKFEQWLDLVFYQLHLTGPKS